jgi:hypothetical protein
MLLGNRARPVRECDNLVAIGEPIVWTMWDPQRFTALQASTACYEDSFTFCILYNFRIFLFNVLNIVENIVSRFDLTTDRDKGVSVYMFEVCMLPSVMNIPI